MHMLINDSALKYKLMTDKFRTGTIRFGISQYFVVFIGKQQNISFHHYFYSQVKEFPHLRMKKAILEEIKQGQMLAHYKQFRKI